MTVALFPDSKWLIERAAQCRALGRGSRDPMERSRMLRLAIDCEFLAESAVEIKAIEEPMNKAADDHRRRKMIPSRPGR